MASLLLNAAPVDYQDNININNININNNKSNNFSKKSKNKTIKNQNNQNNLNNLNNLNNINNENNVNNQNQNNQNLKIRAEMLKESFENSDDDSDDDLQNFTPVQEDNIKSNNNPLNSINSQEYVSDYYKNYLKNNQVNSGLESISNNELLKKLDNILYLLEDQNDEKNSYVTEELILYVFLGIFIIYVLDSFVRVGKYTR